jgi:hypothetical protein
MENKFRYQNDPLFHAVVESMVSMLGNGVSFSDLVACVHTAVDIYIFRLRENEDHTPKG